MVFNMVFVKQTLTITTYSEKVEIKNCWWLVIKEFAVLELGTIISGKALIISAPDLLKYGLISTAWKVPNEDPLDIDRNAVRGVVSIRI